MMFHGYELLSEWKNGQCSQIAKACKGGKEYFLKKYQTPVAPIDNGTLDAKTFKHNEKLFEKFVNTRKRINAEIRKVTGPGGNIIIPCDEFIEGNHYVEATEFINGVVQRDDLKHVLAGLSVDVKKLLMQTAAGALFSVHNYQIIHSDLKLENVLLVKNSTGNYVAKLIDFDSSYFADEKPDEIIGTIDYYSPELGAYADAEDDREEMGKNLTVKSDIFSLGLIFHFYLSGSFPTPVSLTERLRRWQGKGHAIYCWIALNDGCSLQLSPKISESYRSLIQDMLSLDPKDRPSAGEVLRRLQKIREDPPHITPRKTGDGSSTTEIKVSKGFCEPWPEHNIKFDTDRIKSRGFVSVERDIVGGIKGYKFYKSNSQTNFLRIEMMLALKYAAKKAAVPVDDGAEIEIDSPWPEHRIEFDFDAVKARGFVKVRQDVMNGVKGYKFTRANGMSQFIRVEMVLIQNMARKL